MEFPIKLGISGGALFIFGILFGWVIFPPVLRSQVVKATRLKPKGERRPLWEKIPFELDFKIYLFNVTNHEEIQNGGKPKVQEVGPFWFKETKEKVNLEDFEDEDEVEYNTRVSFRYDMEASKGLTGQEEVILPHVVILGIVLTALAEKPKLMGLVGKAIDSIFNKPENIFFKVKPMDLFFNGILIDCSEVKDVPGKGVCSLMKSEAGNILEVEPNKFLFSLFGDRNYTISKQRWRVQRGIKNIKNVGMVVRFDGKERMELYGEGRCNDINGTDGTIFSPFMTEKTIIRAYSADICRVMEIKYEKPSKVEGLKTGHFTADFGDIPNDPEKQCYCKDVEKCFKKGTIDMFSCVKAPLVGTLPHFYLADESYVQAVDGVNPKKELHEIFLDFDLFTASPVHARTRMQFNLPFVKIERLKLMANLPELLMPLLWIEEGVLLPKDLIKQVKLAQTVQKVVGVVKYIMMMAGLCMCFYAGFLKYKANKQSKQLEISKVSPRVSNKGESGEPKKWPLDPNNLQAAAVPPNLDAN